MGREVDNKLADLKFDWRAAFRKNKLRKYEGILAEAQDVTFVTLPVLTWPNNSYVESINNRFRRVVLTAFHSRINSVMVYVTTAAPVL